MTAYSGHVVVSAGAAGIGAAIAKQFSANGYLVSIIDQDAAACAKALEANPHYRGAVVDVTKEAEVADFFSTTSSLEPLTCLVNCAGIAGPTAMLEEMSLADWQRCIGVNLDGTFLCCKYAIPKLKENPTARDSRAASIINISSTAGIHGYPLRTPYASAKWAVLGLTKSLAMELGPWGIRANAICPGSVNGERMDRVIAAEALQKGTSESAIRDTYTSGVSLRTFVEGEDIAQMAGFLASTAANKITGQVISVDGFVENPGSMPDELVRE